jgi:hypothetical protein
MPPAAPWPPAADPPGRVSAHAASNQPRWSASENRSQIRADRIFYSFLGRYKALRSDDNVGGCRGLRRPLRRQRTQPVERPIQLQLLRVGEEPGGEERPLSRQPAAEELDTHDAAGLPVNHRNRMHIWIASQLSVIGVAELKPQPPVPHRLTA